MSKIQNIINDLNLLEDTLLQKDHDLFIQTREANRYKNILLEFLKSKIGQKIYWAHKDWRKYETHTISAVNVELQDTDFFGSEYVGKMCIRIYLEDGGYYIADKIGKTLFFDEGVAALRTYNGEK